MVVPSWKAWYLGFTHLMCSVVEELERRLGVGIILCSLVQWDCGRASSSDENIVIRNKVTCLVLDCIRAECVGVPELSATQDQAEIPPIESFSGLPVQSPWIQW
jgi:hypothetical protein